LVKVVMLLKYATPRLTGFPIGMKPRSMATDASRRVR
jgi:hypothetical protein